MKVQLVAILVAAAVTACSPGPALPSPPTAASAPNPTTSSLSAAEKQDPRHYAQQVRTHAEAASVSPRLLMAILYNESYKPHDPALERAWQKIDPDASFGVANMHKATFDEAKQGRDFADRDWQELPDDPGLAVAAAAWHLHDLDALLPQSWTDAYSRDELLALGYNAGASSMLAFANNTRPGKLAQAYLDRLRTNWPLAEDAIRTG
ncbi:lytic transglycosylase domain-containing protein [Lentzea sp. NPDC051838]|uniref:lytic transglycosylase domain-containing protein n=1 Tax=Lentzea sp. NPDC051838 TaxID=3154849 RepID=UPI0034298AF4